MAAKFEIYLEVQSWLEPHCVFPLLAASPRIIRIAKIDNWSWAHEPELCMNADMQAITDNGSIVLIDASDAFYGNVGMSIEQAGQGYLYALWFDTCVMEALDSSVITKENAGFYQQIYTRFSDLVRETRLDFRYLAIGSEAVLESGADINSMLRSSSGIAAWIINSAYCSILNHAPYSRRYLDAINFHLLEKQGGFL